MNYLDFDLAIEALPGMPTIYRARVLNSPAGQATVDFILPFNAYELENYILKMGRRRRQVRSLSLEVFTKMQRSKARQEDSKRKR